MNDLIDPNVRRLVEALNRFPGVTTFSSCGGHPDFDDEAGQCPENIFYVHFSLDPGDGYAAMMSLGVLTGVCEKFETLGDDVGASITTFTQGDPTTIAFQIEGENVEPDTFADALDEISNAFVTVDVPPLPPMSKLN